MLPVSMTATVGSGLERGLNHVLPKPSGCALSVGTVDELVDLCQKGTAQSAFQIATTPEWCQQNRPHTRLKLSPDRPVIVGRSDNHAVSYLDPAFRPTTIVPGSGQEVLTHRNLVADNCVSRAHFMLRSHVRGIWLVNGVPRPEGGLRPPRNGTRLIHPENRAMQDGEEYLVESGVTVLILLPNEVAIAITAD
ncbi:MAG: hypothetical protein JSS02_19870 [Planctomycetes bacterium]|nr:hypothetical protein [Planctomycetota bacterium]